MNIIVAVDKNWGIGYHGELQVRNSEDLKRFKELTTNNIVVLGTKTLDTFPGKKPLPDRINIILNDQEEEKEFDGNYIVTSFEEAIDKIKKLQKEFPKKQVYIVGGASIYKQFLDYSNMAIVTKWDFEEEADAYFPNLSELDNWKIYSEQNIKNDEGNYIVSTYINEKVKEI